ncbi:MAG: hypothetical protein DRI37_03650 [Chloroflexi bacterium]|nr:MAG: hypothetical protein DRI37_03650 [Chloroflexota bacterium]
MAKPNRRRARSADSFKRRPGSRPPRQCILVVCEGLKTEPNYFKALCRELKLTSVEVEVVTGEGSAPISVVDSALELKHRRERDVRKERTTKLKFDEVWCVFDRENPQDNPSFPRAVNKATSNKLELAVSTPAFEYWYLLHFIYTDKPFRDASEVIEVLKKHIPHYEKNQDIFNRCELLERTAVAIERAARGWSQRVDKNERFPNSSTLVFKLVQKLQDMSQRE